MLSIKVRAQCCCLELEADIQQHLAQEPCLSSAKHHKERNNLAGPLGKIPATLFNNAFWKAVTKFQRYKIATGLQFHFQMGKKEVLNKSIITCGFQGGLGFLVYLHVADWILYNICIIKYRYIALREEKNIEDWLCFCIFFQTLQNIHSHMKVKRVLCGLNKEDRQELESAILKSCKNNTTKAYWYQSCVSQQTYLYRSMTWISQCKLLTFASVQILENLQ